MANARIDGPRSFRYPIVAIAPLKEHQNEKQQMDRLYQASNNEIIIQPILGADFSSPEVNGHVRRAFDKRYESDMQRTSAESAPLLFTYLLEPRGCDSPVPICKF